MSATTAAAVLSVSVQSFAQGYLPPQQTQPQPAPTQQPAVAPNGQYVAPTQQQQQQMYVPQTMGVQGPRVIRDWSEGEPIPAGYHPVSRVRGGLIGGGIGLFAPFYIISALVGAVGNDVCSDGTGGTCSNTLWPLFIPVVGPFITIGTTGTGATGGFFLAFDGLAQAGGIAMVIIGAIGRTELVRNDLGAAKSPLEFKVGKASLEVQPMLGMGQTHSGHGMGLHLSF